MKVLLLNISLRPESQVLMLPVGLAYIATAIEQAGFELEIIDIDAHRYSDTELETMIRDKEYDVVAMGCIVTAYKTVKNLTHMIKQHRDVPIMVGNSVADSIPEILLKNTEADIAVVGEGDITGVEVLQALDQKQSLSTVPGIYYKVNGNIYSTPLREPIADIDSIPYINWSLFDMDIYLEKSRRHVDEPYPPIPFEQIKAMPINTARGCAFKCTFCYHVFRNNKYRVRSPQVICDEIKMLKEQYGINYVNFFDELTFYSIPQVNNFLDIMEKNQLDVYWAGPCRGNLFREKDLDVAKRMKALGCIGLVYSLESANQEILTAMNKHLNKNQFIEQTRTLRKAGLATWTSLVIGYPQETEETLKETFDCCYEAEIYPSVGYLIPLPGTPIYQYALETGAIKDEEEFLLNAGDRQDFRINLTQMEPQKIQDLVAHHLMRISQKMGLGLDESKLVKTGHYKAKKEEAKN